MEASLLRGPIRRDPNLERARDLCGRPTRPHPGSRWCCVLVIVRMRIRVLQETKESDEL